MSAPSNNNMLASITASLEKSLKKCTLNHHQTTPNSAAGLVYSSSSSSDSPGNPSNYSDATTTLSLDLNSQISLPYHWEQCLDLKSGEIYYINWTTGMKAREDPRTSTPEDQLTIGNNDLYYTEEEEEEDEDDNDGRGRSRSRSRSRSSSSSYDTDSEQGSSSKLKSSASPPAGASSSILMNEQLYHQNTTDDDDDDDDDDQVLVVAGCKVCLMYFMVPKQVQHCPKCTTAQLLHFL